MTVDACDKRIALEPVIDEKVCKRAGLRRRQTGRLKQKMQRGRRGLVSAEDALQMSPGEICSNLP